MGLVLRIDVDKPYGRGTIFQKVFSKIREDYFFPCLSPLGYLDHLNILLEKLNKEKIKSYIYFRNCTLPNRGLAKSIVEAGHLVGFHAENTRSRDTFKSEYLNFKNNLGNLPIDSFTKHGSGQLKLGRNHYPPYEPEKYLEWSNELNVPFRFGNDVMLENNNTESNKDYFPQMFWLNHSYRDQDKFPLKLAIEKAKSTDVIVIIHPSNYVADPNVFEDMNELIKLSKENAVNWITFNR